MGYLRDFHCQLLGGFSLSATWWIFTVSYLRDFHCGLLEGFLVVSYLVDFCPELLEGFLLSATWLISWLISCVWQLYHPPYFSIQ